MNERDDIINEIKDLAMQPATYSYKFTSQDDMDIVEITCPEWIGLMDDVFQARGYALDLVALDKEDGFIRVQYMRDIE